MRGGGAVAGNPVNYGLVPSRDAGGAEEGDAVLHDGKGVREGLAREVVAQEGGMERADVLPGNFIGGQEGYGFFFGKAPDGEGIGRVEDEERNAQTDRRHVRAAMR